MGLGRSLESSRVLDALKELRPKTTGTFDSGRRGQSSRVEQGVMPVESKPLRPMCLGNSVESLVIEPANQESQSSPSSPNKGGVPSPCGKSENSLLSSGTGSDQSCSSTLLQGSMLSPKAQHGRALFLSAVDDDTMGDGPEFDGKQVLKPHAFV